MVHIFKRRALSYTWKYIFFLHVPHPALPSHSPSFPKGFVYHFCSCWNHVLQTIWYFLKCPLKLWGRQKVWYFYSVPDIFGWVFVCLFLNKTLLVLVFKFSLKGFSSKVIFMIGPNYCLTYFLLVHELISLKLIRLVYSAKKIM